MQVTVLPVMFSDGNSPARTVPLFRVIDADGKAIKANRFSNLLQVEFDASFLVIAEIGFWFEKCHANCRLEVDPRRGS